MFRWRRSEQIPELNTSSTADISFMLLIFFLVTSSMDTDKGFLRQLPPPPPQDEISPIDIQKEHVLTIMLDAEDQLACNGSLLTPTQLTAEVMDFVKADPNEHIISIQTDRKTTYEAYYNMQNAIITAYQRLRATGKNYPMHISEQRPKEGGGQ